MGEASPGGPGDANGSRQLPGSGWRLLGAQLLPRGLGRTRQVGQAGDPCGSRLGRAVRPMLPKARVPRYPQKLRLLTTV